MWLPPHSLRVGLCAMQSCCLLALASGQTRLEELLARAAARAMQGKAGAVVVAEVSSGRLLAEHGLKVAATRLAAPGSAIKPFTLLALLESGKFNPASGLACPRQLRLGDRQLNCTHPAVSFPLEARAALAYSCNCYFAQMALLLDAAGFAQALQRAGLVSLTGFAQPEVAGSIRTAASREELQLEALGEAGIEVTPLGLLAAYRRLALRRSKAEARLAPLFGGLEDATAYGTGQLAQPKGMKVAGKTGTAASRQGAGTHAWFAGWAPAASPEIVLVVFLEQARGGAGAAPVAGAIFEAYQQAKSPAAGTRQVTVRVQRQTLRLPLEYYVAAVLAGECGTFTSEEALKAMAVAARSYAVGHLGRHGAEGFDFCDTTHCQRLLPEGRSERLRAAAEATEGELLWYEGAPAAAYYHRHCGGMTETPANVWPRLRAPYLRQQADSYCVATGRGDWSSTIRKDDLRSVLPVRGPVSVDILRRTPSGRVAQLRVSDAVWNAQDFELAVGRRLGWDLLRSRWFEVSDTGDALVFRGYGSGHGVGLCQVGAEQRGREGHSYRQILDHYYPGTAVGLSAQGFAWTRLGGERVEVWSTRPQQDEFVVALGDRLLEEAERRAGFALAARPRLKVYPTVAAFRDATGEPGWVAASTKGGTIRLQPPGAIGATGELQATLRHEMLHLVVESRAHPTLPAWFREGLVLYLAGPEPPAPKGGAAQLPEEARVRQSYTAAYARVRALVERHDRLAVMSWLERGLPAELTTSIPRAPSGR